MKHQITVTYTLEDTRLKRASVTGNNSPMDDVTALRFVSEETVKGLNRIETEIVSRAAEIINSKNKSLGKAL